MGPGHDDHGGLRRHGAQDLSRDVRGGDVRHGRGPGGGASSTCYRVQLRDVLLPHPGPGKTAKKEEKSCQC